MIASLVLLAVSVASGFSLRAGACAVVAITLLAWIRPTYVGWPRLLAGLILVILFVPIRRYSLPGNLPFELEPYRLLVVLLLVGWGASLLVDPRVRFRKTGFEGPLLLIFASIVGSLVSNPDRVEQLSSAVQKELMFFISFVLVLYLTASVIRRLDNIDYLAMTLVAGGAVVALLRDRRGSHRDQRVQPPRPRPAVPPTQCCEGEPEAFVKHGAAKLRVFGSAQHPIALSAAFVLLAPLGLYLARRYRQRRWWLCVTLLVAGCASTVSRTGIMMFVVVALVFLWLRPKETRRLWPVLIPALIVIKLVLPGTLGAIKQSFLPAGGLVAEQQSMPGESGSGRLADIGPALQEWKQKPLLGAGLRHARRRTPGPRIRANILDNEWLGTLIEVGALGFFGWLWFFARVVRRFGKEAKEDDSDRGWLLVSIAASVAAFAVGMFTFDAFSFIQVTFLMFVLVGLGAALVGQRPTPLARRSVRPTGTPV